MDDDKDCAPTARVAKFIEALGARRGFPAWALALTFTSVLLVYFYQGAIPVFNADDIMQIQWPDDTWSFIAQGRWGYYWIFGFLMHSNPAPLFSTIVGVALLVTTGLIAAHILEFRLAITIGVFVLVGAVSVYYGDVFSFHSTRIAYPFGNLLAAAGLFALIRRPRLVGVVLLAIAPGFCQVASELAAVILVGWALRRLMEPRGLAVLPELIWATAGFVASLVLYFAGTRVAYALLGMPLNERMSLDALALFHRFHEVRALVTHSLPILGLEAPELDQSGLVRGPGKSYLPTAVKMCATALGAAFLTFSVVAAYRSSGARAAAAAVVLNLALLVAPWFLILASGGAGFPPRSLYALSTVHAIWGAALLEASALSGPRAAVLASLTACGLLVLASATRVNELVFDQYLASQSDLLATNRIIARIDDLLADTPGAPTDDIPLAVIYDRPTMSGPRGAVWTARQAPWSREFIFRLVDRRFHWVPPARYQHAWQAAQMHPEWPARGSVFLDDGVVVVVVSK
jgi:hypothetical protein